MRMKTLKSFLGALAVLMVMSVGAKAGSFSANFDDGLVPAGSAVAGSAVIEMTGGVGGSGVLKLTKAINTQQGAFVVEDLDAGAAVNGFDVTFSVRLGGGTATPADGFSFCVASDLPGAPTTWGEEGAGSGLIVAFDTYDNTDGNPDNGVGEAPAIDVRWGTVEIAHTLVPLSLLRTGTNYVVVNIRLEPDGSLDVVYNGSVIYSNLNIIPSGFAPITGARYGFGARTGGLNENQWIDDLSIATTTGSLTLAFIEQPADIVALSGSRVTFYSQVNDPANVLFPQWRTKRPADADFEEVIGANMLNYTTEVLTPEDNGTQFVLDVEGANNSVTSRVATLTIVDISLPTPAVSFSFDDGAVPPNTAVHGSATVTLDGGVGNSGALRLTEAVNDQSGAFVIGDLDSGMAIDGIVATWRLQMGPGSSPPADGFSFNWASDLPDGTFPSPVEGTGNGLSVSFDTFDNGAGEAPAVDIKFGGVTVASRTIPVGHLVLGTFADVLIRLESDGTVDVAYNGELLHSNVVVSGFTAIGGGRFGFAAATGGFNEAHYVDDIALTTTLFTGPIVFTRQPSNTTVLVNRTATFSAEVNDPARAMFQWQRRGAADPDFADVTGATSASYTTPTLTAGDNGALYRVRATGPLNTTNSAAALLTVVDLASPDPVNADSVITFDDGMIPPNSMIFGSAYITAFGGVGDSAVLHLTDAANDQNGTFLITQEFESGRAVDSFIAAFSVKVDEGSAPPADGHSFNWAPDFPEGTVAAAEEGAGTGLTVAFDVYDNTDANPNNGVGEAPEITLKWQGVAFANQMVPLNLLRTEGNFVDVLVALSSNGTVSVAYDGQVIFNDVPVPNFFPLAGARFGFAARTGGANENHWLDSIIIQTEPATGLPVIIQHPEDQVLLAGASANLSVRVNDPLAVASYQWQQRAPSAADFSDIPAATSPDFTTPALLISDSGVQYRVLAALTTPGVTLTSRVATVTVVEITVPAPTVSYDFNDGLVPEGAAVFGSTVVGGDGVLHLTDAVNSQQGSFVISNDIAGGGRVYSMTAVFKALISGGSTPPADGMSFAWGQDIAGGPFGEDGAGSDLIVAFDTYDNTDANPNNGVGEAPAIEVRFGGVSLATNMVLLSFLQTEGAFVDVAIRVQADGTIDVVYDNQIVFYNLRLPGYNGLVAAQFGWGGRTGGANDNHWIDDIQIAVDTEPPPTVTAVRSGGDFVITYAGVLQSAPNVEGPYADVPGAVSPHLVPLTGTAQFFRSRAP